jgi:hypothetical protein
MVKIRVIGAGLLKTVLLSNSNLHGNDHICTASGMIA